MSISPRNPSPYPPPPDEPTTDWMPYIGTEAQDWIVLQWFAHMKAVGEIYYVFAGKQTPYHFLRQHQTESALHLQLGFDGKVCCAAWIEPFMTGAFFGLYVREDVRKSRRSLRFVQRAYAWAFAHYPTLIGVVSGSRPDLEKVITEHHKLGYTGPVVVPFVFGGGDAYVFYVTRNTFQPPGIKKHSREAVGVG